MSAEESQGEVVAHATLAEALVAAQGAMPAVEKTAQANYGMYATHDHLIAKTRPVLVKHGLAVTQWVGYDTINGTDGEQFVVHTLTTRVTHVSGESVESKMALVLEANNMQKLGGAITYARRYMLSAALGVSTEEDDDGNQASRDEVRQNATGARRTRSAPQSDPAPVLATPEQVEAYSAAVADAGFDVEIALASLAEPTTPAVIEKAQAELAAIVAARAEPDPSLPFA